MYISIVTIFKSQIICNSLKIQFYLFLRYFQLNLIFKIKIEN